MFFQFKKIIFWEFKIYFTKKKNFFRQNFLMASNEKSKLLLKGIALNNKRYEIVEEIGVGGYGNVFLAFDNKNSKKG